MKMEGQSPSQIIEYFKKKHGLDLKSSTVSSWYNKTNMKGFKALQDAKCVAHDLKINNAQRPHILVGMEYILSRSMIRKQQQGIPMTKERQRSLLRPSIYDF